MADRRTPPGYRTSDRWQKSAALACERYIYCALMDMRKTKITTGGCMSMEEIESSLRRIEAMGIGREGNMGRLVSQLAEHVNTLVKHAIDKDNVSEKIAAIEKSIEEMIQSEVRGSERSIENQISISSAKTEAEIKSIVDVMNGKIEAAKDIAKEQANAARDVASEHSSSAREQAAAAVRLVDAVQKEWLSSKRIGVTILISIFVGTFSAMLFLHSETGKRFDAQTSRFDSVETRLDAQQQQMASVQQQLASINSVLLDIQKNGSK